LGLVAARPDDPVGRGFWLQSQWVVAVPVFSRSLPSIMGFGALSLLQVAIYFIIKSIHLIYCLPSGWSVILFVFLIRAKLT
jgi:hypothetical protein